MVRGASRGNAWRYKHRAKQLRDEAWRDMWRALWALLVKVVRRR